MPDSVKLKNYFWLVLDLLLAAMFVNIVFFVMPTIARWGDSFFPSRTFTVSAEGKTFVVPDIAETSFSVVSRGKDPSAIADENNKKINAAIAFVKSQGMDEKDIQTSGYSLSPNYEYDENRRETFINGYTLTQTVSLRIKNFDRIAPILAGLPPLGINQIGGLNFTVDDQEKFLGAARVEAFRKAKQKAAAIASQGGIRLGKVISVSESQGGYPIYYGRDMKALGMGGAPEAVAAPTIEPGTQEIQLQVSLTYSLE